MNLRELAEKDLQMTIEPPGSQVLTFTSPLGDEFTVSGKVNDIGYGYDSLGNQIATRSISACWRLSSMKQNGSYVEPCIGWQVAWQNLLDHTEIAYVTRFEPDRTMGIGRVYLSLDMA